MISIICIGIEHGQNLGAICRVMANFGIKDLILVDPVCKRDDIDALIRAKHGAAEILKNAKIADFSIIKEQDICIATTARVGASSNIARTPLTPEQMAAIINERNLIDDPKVRVGILIGREGHGLFNDEIKHCDFIVTIPTSQKYPTMNISHAVAILLYEIYKKLGTLGMVNKYRTASGKDKEIILNIIDAVLAKMEFKSESKLKTQRILWKRMIGKATLTKREAFALIGFLKKL